MERRRFPAEVRAGGRRGTLFDVSILRHDVSNPTHTHTHGRPLLHMLDPRRGGNRSVVSRSTLPSFFLARSLVLSLGVSSRRRRRCPTFGTRGSHRVAALLAPLFHRFLAPVIFSRYFIRFAPKPVKADYCASSKRSLGRNRDPSGRSAVDRFTGPTHANVYARSLFLSLSSSRVAGRIQHD